MPREDAQCLHCGSLERDRLAWLFLHARTDLFASRSTRLLHLAPESCLGERFRAHLGGGYVSGDLDDTRAMVRMDVTEIPCPDATFDAVYCSHVLEHVDDDRRALRELHRVLRPGGWAILLVPVQGDRTFEDPRITDPQGRAAAFGQHDHVRQYGRDVVDRFRAVGFRTRVAHAEDLVDDEAAATFGLTSASGRVHLCTR